MGRSAHPGYAYYTCRGKSHPVISCRDEKCPARFIPAQQLDELVWQDVCEVLTHPTLIATALEQAQSGQWLPQEFQARREHFRKARVSLEQQLERLTDAYLAEARCTRGVPAPTTRLGAATASDCCAGTSARGKC